MTATSTPPSRPIGLHEATPIPQDSLGMADKTLNTTTQTVPGHRPRVDSQGSASQSRPARRLMQDSASDPDMQPLFQQRMRLLSVLGMASAVTVALVVTLAKLTTTGGMVDTAYLLKVNASAFAMNLLAYLLLRGDCASKALLFGMHNLFFFGNMLCFVTLPHLETGLKADLYNGAALIVLLRAVFVPCIPIVTTFFGLMLFAVYPATVLLSAHFDPARAAELARPEMWSSFLFGNMDILMHLAVGVVAVHYFHGLRMRAFKAEQAGNYKLLEKLGEGGMGEVWRARHALLPRPTAVKTLRADHVGSPTALKRFEREVRAVSELTHPHTISIYDFGKTEAGSFYYAMEYLEGLDLQKLVEGHGAVEPTRAVHVLEQVLGSLGEAHWRGILHRDIKPSNIYLTMRGRQFDFAKVLDFGLVKETSAEPQFTAGLTADGSITGTPLYMAPERFYGDQEVDQRSDLYAVGAVAYFLVTGRPVFESKNPMQVLIDHARTAPVPPSELGAKLSPELQAVILRALEKDAKKRYASADEFAEGLRSTPEWGAWTQDQAKQWWSTYLPDASVAVSNPITPSE